MKVQCGVFWLVKKISFSQSQFTTDFLCSLSHLKMKRDENFRPKSDNNFLVGITEQYIQDWAKCCFKKNLQIDLIRTLWMACLLKLNWEFSWIYSTQALQKTVPQNLLIPYILTRFCCITCKANFGKEGAEHNCDFLHLKNCLISAIETRAAGSKKLCRR